MSLNHESQGKRSEANDILVSIIIPIYNSEQYIAATIESCLNQTYGHIELILVNDGSTDGTEQVILKFSDPRIRYFKTQNKGGPNARNFGIDKAVGKLIQFLDHDDVLHEEKIMWQLKYYTKYGEDYLYSGTMGSISGTHRTIDAGFELYQKNFTPQQFFEEKFTQFGNDIVTGAWLIPVKLVKSTYGWDPDAGLNDDGEYFMRIILNSAGIVYCKEAIFYFRRDVPTSLSKQFGSKEVYRKWLNSYLSYVTNFQQKFERQKANELSWKALSIYYCNAYPNYPDILKQCKAEMRKLGYNKVAAQGGKLFLSVARIIGVENALWAWNMKKQFRYK